MGGSRSPKPTPSPSGEIIKRLSGPLSDALLKQIIDPTANENLTQRTVQQAIQTSNAQYGARGLAGSGIAQRGAQEAAMDALLRGQERQSQALIGVLGAGSGAPVYPPPQQPRGIFGLK